MMQDAPPKTQDRQASVNDVHTNPEVEALLQQVLECVGEELVPRNPIQENDNNQEVVLELQIDEVCYTLLRSYPQPPEPLINLSPREQEIVRLVAKGHPNKIIAKVLDISPWTVSTHLRRVFTKLGVSSRAEMVARVLHEDLLSIEH